MYIIKINNKDYLTNKSNADSVYFGDNINNSRVFNSVDEARDYIKKYITNKKHWIAGAYEIEDVQIIKVR